MGVIEQLRHAEETRSRLADNVQVLQIEKSELLSVIDSMKQDKGRLEMCLHGAMGSAQGREEEHLKAITELNNVVAERDKSIRLLREAVETSKGHELLMENEHLKAENQDFLHRLSAAHMELAQSQQAQPGIAQKHIEELTMENTDLKNEVRATEDFYLKKTENLEATVQELIQLVESSKTDRALERDNVKMQLPTASYVSASALSQETEIAREHLALEDKITELEVVNKKLVSALQETAHACLEQERESQRAQEGTAAHSMEHHLDQLNIERSEMQDVMHKILTNGVDVEGIISDMKTSFEETLIKVQDNNTHLHGIVSHAMTLQKLLKAESDMKTKQLEALATADDSAVMQLLEETNSHTSTVTALQLRITELTFQTRNLEGELLDARTELEMVAKSVVANDEPSIALVNILKGLLQHQRDITRAAVKECITNDDIVCQLQECLATFNERPKTQAMKENCKNCNELHTYVSDMEDLMVEKEEALAELQKENSWRQEQMLDMEETGVKIVTMREQIEQLNAHIQQVESERSLLQEKWDELVKEHTTTMQLTKVALQERKEQCTRLKEQLQVKEGSDQRQQLSNRNSTQKGIPDRNSEVDDILCSALSKWSVRHTAATTKELARCVASVPFNAMRDAVELLASSLDIYHANDLGCHDIVPLVMRCINRVKGTGPSSRDSNIINTHVDPVKVRSYI